MVAYIYGGNVAWWEHSIVPGSVSGAIEVACAGGTAVLCLVAEVCGADNGGERVVGCIIGDSAWDGAWPDSVVGCVGFSVWDDVASGVCIGGCAGRVGRET